MEYRIVPIDLIRYPGTPPESTSVLRDLGIGENYIYLVATMAMERARGELSPPRQVDEDGKRHLVFHRALRLWLRQLRVPLLTRAEERVALARAAAEIAATDEQLAMQLRHDVFAWRDALAELAAMGLDLSQGIPTELEPLLVNPGVGDLLRRLQEAYRRQQKAAGRRPFEDAAYAYLNTAYTPPRYIVLEGFTFLTPLQHRFITISDQPGVQIYLVHPYRTTQAYAFQIMDATYAPWLSSGNAPRVLETGLATSSSDLRLLQESLFSTSAIPTVVDGSVTISAYGHRHQEVADCVNQLKSLLDLGVRSSDIAIVTRNAGNIEALLREEAELQELPVSLGIPPRLLLLTPLGRFALTLYEVWKADSLQIDAEQFETLLASGWLGGAVQATAEIFSAVRAQFFAHCETEAEWDERLRKIAEARTTVTPGSRMSVSLVTDSVIVKWREARFIIRAICQRLFAGGTRSIGEHVQRLLDELARLAPEQMRRSEREVLERIQEALTQVATATSLAMSSAEFGEVLNSLVREYDSAEDEQEDLGAEPDHGVWVTTPEGIDGRLRDHVIYLGVDSLRVPRAYAELWPFYQVNIEAHQHKERYLFLAVVRAACRHLHLSYARSDEDALLRPSPYLEEVADLLGVHLHPPSLAAPASPPDAPFAMKIALRARRTSYSLAEIAHAGLCPYRYKLERLSPAAAVYRAPFQLRFLAQSHWLDRVLADIRERQDWAIGLDNIEAMFFEAMEATREKVQATFPGLRALEWHAAGEGVGDVLQYWARHYASKGQYKVSVASPGQTTISVDIGDRTVEVDARLRHAIKVGKYDSPFVNDLLLEEWLLPGATPKDGDEETIRLADGTEVFGSLYHAVSWWRNAIRNAFDFQRMTAQTSRPPHYDKVRRSYVELQEELITRIAAIEAGRYPKNSGAHCRFCPVRLDCLGLEP